jgi:hypothetical protein
MSAKVRGPEQFTVRRFVEVTASEFDQALNTWKFILLAIHSRIDAERMARSLADSRGLQIFDRRRSLSPAEMRKLDYLEEIAESANEFASWAREQNLQPILRDLFVAQCSALEHFLKSIGVAAKIVKDHPERMECQIFVPDKKFRSTHDDVIDLWQRKRGSESRIPGFLDELFDSNDEMRLAYPRWQSVSTSTAVNLLNEAFRLRNAIVHSRGRPKQQILIGDEVFQPLDEAIVTEWTIRNVEQECRVVLDAFRLTLDDL